MRAGLYEPYTMPYVSLKQIRSMSNDSVPLGNVVGCFSLRVHRNKGEERAG